MTYERPQYYIKKGRRYIPVEPFYGFPTNGVWLVQDGSQGVFMRVGDVPDPMPLAAMKRHEDTACRAIAEERDKPGGASASDLWEAACMAIQKEEQKA
jgi:hypothetical protein